MSKELTAKEWLSEEAFKIEEGHEDYFPDDWVEASDLAMAIEGLAEDYHKRRLKELSDK